MRISPFILLCTFISTLSAQAKKADIGYLFPAGGQQGTTVTITAGGQNFSKADKVYISGNGVSGKIIAKAHMAGNIRKEGRQLLIESLQAVRDRRLAELEGKELPTFDLKTEQTEKLKELDKVALKRAEVLFKHPLLVNLENKSLRELAHLNKMIFYPRDKLQMNRQLNELLTIELTIAPDAEPGYRELRIGFQRNISNPITFHIGTLPETSELEPNDKQAFQSFHNLLKLPSKTKLPADKPLELPVTINGQIMPGDTDRFQFQAKGGEKLVIEAQARSLIPYLADAVPGWFQATISLYDGQGKEIAYADDFRFNPDPVLFFEIPKAGLYELKIHDSIYRGREDFVYRLVIGEQPFITSTIPLGGP